MTCLRIVHAFTFFDMKHVPLPLLLLLFFCHSTFSHAQTYRPFPIDNAYWQYRYYNDVGIPTNDVGHLTLSGDTVISGVAYKKIWTGSPPTYYAGALRESAKVIYFVPDTSSQAYVLYDFNLGLGDTLFNPFGNNSSGNDTLVVDFVDSVQATDGFHRRLTFSTQAKWIEGIGSMNYFFHPVELLLVSGNDQLECMSSDLPFTYPTSVSVCDALHAVSEKLHSTLHIAPNPAHGHVTVVSEVAIQRYEVLDMVGRSLKVCTLQNGHDFQVDLPGNGTFILVVMDVQGNVLHRKVLNRM
jgi:hypothetical protein